MKHFDLENDKKIESGFKTPDHYFDSFEERLMQRISFDENKIETGFETPDNYFDSLEEKVMQKVFSERNEVKVISLWQRKSTWVSGIAAAVIISLGIWMYIEQQTAENITISQEYLAYESDITTEDIAQHLTNEDIAALETELNTFDSKTEQYINEYLD